MMFQFSLLTILVVSGIGSSLQKTRPILSPIDTNQAVISYHTTSNEGNSPTFGVVIHGTGFVEYTGEEFVTKVGCVTYHIDPASVRKLLRKLEALHYYVQPDSVAHVESDWSTIRTSVRIGPRFKQVVDESNGRSNSDLLAIEEAIVRTSGVAKLAGKIH